MEPARKFQARLIWVASSKYGLACFEHLEAFAHQLGVGWLNVAPAGLESGNKFMKDPFLAPRFDWGSRGAGLPRCSGCILAVASTPLHY